jgi:hypothetical protein
MSLASMFSGALCYLNITTVCSAGWLIYDAELQTSFVFLYYLSFYLFATLHLLHGINRMHRPAEASSSVGDGISGTSSSSGGGYISQIYNNMQYRQSGQQPSQRGLNYQLSTATANTSSNYMQASERTHQNGHVQFQWTPRYTISQSHPSNSLLGNGIWGNFFGFFPSLSNLFLMHLSYYILFVHRSERWAFLGSGFTTQK